MKNNIVVFLFAVFFISSCANSSVFQEYRTLDDESWDIDSTLNFSVPVVDTLSTYRLFVNVRNTLSYGNSNLWVFVKKESVNGEISMDTVNCILADIRGMWLGKGLGDIYDSSHLVEDGLVFKRKGNYSFTLMHGMRNKKIKGIRDIGISIEKIEKVVGRGKK